VNEKIDERFEEINQLIEDKYDAIKDQIDEMRTAYEKQLEDKFADLDIERKTHPLDMLLSTRKVINYKYGRDGELVGYSVLQLSDDGHLANTEHDPSTGNVSSINHISPINEESVDFYAKTMAKNDRLNLELFGKSKIIVVD
jgi:Mg2+ and Co2+ transporter CorA